MKKNKKELLRNFKLPIVIAEIGLNHNGDVNLAKKSIKAAHLAGADLVKLQTFKSASICSEKSKYFNIFKTCELSKKQLKHLFNFAQNENINLFSAVFDEWAVDTISEFDPCLLKIASGDITHIPLIQYAAKSKIPLLLSTGGSTMKEIKESVNSIKKIDKKLAYYLLHCVSNYPTSIKDTNLLCLQEMENIFKVPIGFSDHTKSNITSIAASSLGAKFIEKHFTLDKRLSGPDHSLSSNPKEFKNLVDSVKLAYISRGKKRKKPVEDSMVIKIMRRGLYIKEDISSGERITPNNIIVSRPSSGIKPKFYNKILGKKTSRSLKKGSSLKWKDIKR